MSAEPIPIAPQHDPGQPADAHGDAHGYREALHDLIGMGTDFARLLHAQATAQAQAAQPVPVPAPHATAAPPAPAPDTLISLSAAFDRITRAVRRSIALARSLAEPLQPAQDPARPRAAARRRIIREVEDAIQRTSDPAEPTDAEALHAELRDRFDAPDLDDDIATRPVADIISEICRDLGLAAPPGGAHPWKRRTPEDIGQLRARAAAPTTLRHPAAAPQEPRNDAPARSPDPQPDKRAPTFVTTGVPRAQPGPIHPGSNPPGNPADMPIALHHPTRIQARWHPRSGP